MQIIRQASANETRESAGGELARLLQIYHDKPVLLLLSGGSCFLLLDSIHQTTLGSHVLIAMLDERADTREEVNNFAQLTKTDFYAKAIAQGAQFVDSRLMPGEHAGELAERMNKIFFDWLADHANGNVLATIGVGADGHIAGIMPFPENPQKFTELFENNKRQVIDYDAGNKNEYPLRVTVTLPFLRKNITNAIVYAVGEAKQPALARVLTERGTLAETPARILREMNDVLLFTDIKE